MSNNIQILNFNHNVVEVGSDNKLIITDNIKYNSVTIPQPVTNILQINSPGPQGSMPTPIGPDGAIQFKSGSEFSGEQEFKYDYANNNVIITGSVHISSVLNLSKLNPLPTGTTGSLAVSGSHLYFHDGTNWIQAV
jgi:hypothetical protein